MSHSDGDGAVRKEPMEHEVPHLPSDSSSDEDEEANRRSLTGVCEVIFTLFSSFPARCRYQRANLSQVYDLFIVARHTWNKEGYTESTQLGTFYCAGPVCRPHRHRRR